MRHPVQHRALRIIAAVGVALLAACAGHARPVAVDTASDEAVYASRYVDVMQKGLGDQYNTRTLEDVRGARNGKPLPHSGISAISSQALAEARAYAKANNSTAFLVWHDGALDEASYFGAATATTPLISKSLAKPLSSIAIGRAIQLGKIKSLDQPVSDFITEWKGGPKAGMKIRYLLDMRSGLLGQRAAPEKDDIINRVYLHPRHDQILINEYPLIYTPGTRYDYANAVADLVAIVIERSTGMRYADFLSKEVLQPIGAAGGQVWVDRPGGLAHSACCTLLPAETWLRFGILLVDDGKWQGRQILPVGYVEEMRKGTPQNTHYGLGVYVSTPYVQRLGATNPDTPGPTVLHSEPYLSKDLFLFDGNLNQVVYMVPSERLVILRMGNQPLKTPEWDNTALPNMILRGLPTANGAPRQPQPQG